MNFNPRSPHGERRYEPGSLPLEIGFQSTLSSRRATRCPNCLLGTQEISIHALLTESDRRRHRPLYAPGNFNPRSPHGERRRSHALQFHRISHFNPRSPHGERPANSFADFSGFKDFNPRSPHGERRAPTVYYVDENHISIHALLTESDLATSPSASVPIAGFQSTLSSRRATVVQNEFVIAIKFQSTLSSRRATANTTKLALSFLSKVPILGWEKSKKAKGSANARGSFPVYGKNKVRIPWGDFECFRFAPIK